MSQPDERGVPGLPKKPPRLLPTRGLSGGILVAVIAVMVFLAAMALAGGLALGGAIGQWRDALARDVTVQVPAGKGADATVSAAEAALRAMPGIADVRVLPRVELEALLEPWLGRGNVSAELVLPRLIDVALAPGGGADVIGIQAVLDKSAPGARVDDPTSWLSGVVGIARRAQILAGLAVALVLAALVAIVVFATRAGLEANRGLVSVLHQIGARDDFVAGVFQRHFLGLGLRGAVLGLAMAVAALAVVAGLGQVDAFGAGSFLGGLSLSPGQWVIIAALAPVVAGMTTLTAYLTMRRALAQLV